MFNEHFSFLSSSSNPLGASAMCCTSTDISPLASRCTSPVSSGTVAYKASRDIKHGSSRLSRPSMAALTAQFESHSLSHRRRPSYTSDWSEGSSPLSTSEDEGYFEGPETPRSTLSDSCDDPSLYDLSMFDVNTTSSPRPSLSLEAQATSPHSIRRRQRQVLIRLQCLVKQAPDLAMLIEECHPSSTPDDICWSMTGRPGSACSITSGRVEKNCRDRAMVRKTTRMRKSRYGCD